MARCGLPRCAPRARPAGLAPGMMLADARALLPPLQVHPAEPAADARLLDELITWCERYTPLVAQDRSAGHEAGGALWLDLTGCAHLFGGEAALCADLLARLARQGLAAAAGIADCPGAAWAAARFAAPGAGSCRRMAPPQRSPRCRSRRCGSSPSSPRCSSASASPASATSTPCPARR